jgi:hypothetical protein
MNAPRFDRLTHALTAGASRRGILHGLASAGLGLMVFKTSVAVEARKKRAKKIKRNSFGCVDVGLACRGNSDNCCSGICQGKKPKKGKKDRSRCVAHDAGICLLEPGVCAETYTGCGPLGVCGLTTGKACFCAAINGLCSVCQKDADCVALGWGLGAACLVTDGCPETGGTFCAPPGS